MTFKKTTNILYLIMSFSVVASGGDSLVDTGSFGEFTPRALLQAEKPWKIWRAVGTVDKSGFPCDRTGGSCRIVKDYRFEEVFPQVTNRVAEIGRGQPKFEVQRTNAGTLRTVKIKRLDNRTLVRVDQNRSSSLLGADGAMTSQLNRIDSSGMAVPLGFEESKAAAWARLNPHSFYYLDKNEPIFGLTVVESLMLGGLVQNFFSGTAGKERLRSGTYWCQSDEWRLSQGFIEGLLKNDEFNMQACKGTKLVSSDTEKSVRELAANWFFNRVDSKVTLHTDDNYQYEVETNREFVCPFDCDGSVYRIHGSGRQNVIKITSDKRTWTSSTNVKIKIVTADFDGDGITIQDRNIDLRSIANEPSKYKDIVAIIVSELKDLRDRRALNASYTQHTYFAFPPRVYGGIPSQYKAALERFRSNVGDDFDGLVQLAYQTRLLDQILAMMPDQVQTSPELADAEEKLDELRVFLTWVLKGKNTDAISPDLLFDVLSETDSTTAISWQSPGRSKTKKGKIESMLDLLKL